MDRKSLLVGVAGLAAVGVGAAVYVWLKEDDEGEEEEGRRNKKHVSSRQTV